MPAPNFTDPALEARLHDPARTADLRSSLTLLARIEASLRQSQKALLARDLAGLEQGIREQTEWQGTLAELWVPHGPGPENVPRRFAAQGNPAAGNAESRKQLRAAQHAAARVLALGRVQALLLGRAQRSLTMLGNLMAGPQASYHPLTHTSAPAAACTGPERSA